MVGSSRNSTFGLCSRAAMSSIFMRSPSDKLADHDVRTCPSREELGQVADGPLKRFGRDAVNFAI
jgi:hypothetical protein